MKVCVMQPPYAEDVTLSQEYFDYKMALLDRCDEDLDLIVLPEYSDIPCVVSSKEEAEFYHKKYGEALLTKCAETAKRCHALVFVNALSKEETGYRNTTYAYSRDGELLGKYFKKHVPAAEEKKVDHDYTYSFSTPYILEIEGLRFAFLTCYDFYFYEAYANIARENVDIIIGCSHQRSDTHQAIEIMCRFLAYNTGAYVVRSSVSFDEKADICGASMVVSPSGEVLCNMKGAFGMATAEFDPRQKYLKPAGYGNPLAQHYEYIEIGRKPWQYRPAGSAIIKPNGRLGYPRICAHRGFSAVAPENSLPAYGAAVALGAEEIEFDLWPTKDGEIVSCHDDSLERISTGEGFVYNHTLAELKEYDFGVKFGEHFKGLSIATFEDILQKFSCHTIMNIHIKPLSEDKPYPKDYMKKIVDLVHKYDCEQYVYFMLQTDAMIKQFREYAPHIPVCVGHLPERPWEIVDRAITYGCQRVQFFKPYLSKELVDKAHKHGIICNVFWSDDPKEAQDFLDMGMDVILTNDYLLVKNGIR